LVTTHISQVHIFDIATAKKQTLWADPTYECGVKKVAISPDGKTIALAGHRREDQRDRPQVRLLDARTHKQLALFEPENGGEIHALLFDPTGKRLAASVGGDLHLWDVAQRKNIAVLKKLGYYNLTFSPDGQSLASPTSIIQLSGKETPLPKVP